MYLQKSIAFTETKMGVPMYKCKSGCLICQVHTQNDEADQPFVDLNILKDN